MGKYYQVYHNTPADIWIWQSIDRVTVVKLNQNDTGVFFTTLENSEYRNQLQGIEQNGTSLEAIKPEVFEKALDQVLNSLKKLRQ